MADPHVLVVSQVYHPEPNFITADVAEAMADGARVTVVTAHPNYPLGSFYPGTRWWRPSRSRDGNVTVWRVPIYPDHSLSKVRRALSYLSFALAAGILAPLVAPRPSVVWIYHGPYSGGLVAFWYRWLSRARIVVTYADLWPESFVASGIAGAGLVTRVMFAYRKAVNRAAHAIVCCTRGTLERFRKDGIPEERLTYVPVWVEGVAETDLGPGGAPARNIVYAGNLGPSQRVDVLIRAAALLREKGRDVGVDIYGSGSAEASYRALARELGAANVTFHGRVAPETAFTASSEALAQFVALQPSPLFLMTVPSKLYAAMAAGSPILYGLQGESASIVEASGGGVAFDPEDPASLVSAIEDLLDRPEERHRAMRESLRAHYRKNFSRNRLLDSYARILRPSA